MPAFFHYILYGPGSLNTKLFLALNHAHHPLLDPVMKLMVTIGSPTFAYVYIAIALLAALVNRRKMPFSYVIAFSLATIVGVLLEEGLKGYFHVPRPVATLGLEHVRVLGGVRLANSLPSGHAAFAAVLASTMGWRRGWRWNVPLWLFALLVCWSRIYVGAYYPLDVLAGTLVGTFAGTAVWGLWERIGTRKGKKSRR